MDEFVSIAYEKADNFRDKYKLGNYCANQLLEILNSLELTEKVSIKLIRTPFKNMNLAGFIGFKHGEFIIVTNTNQTLGSERFTIAHEIYHLIENRVSVKSNPVIEELTGKDSSNINEKMANAFAAELLMPKDDLKSSVDGMTKNSTKPIDAVTVIKLQNKYGVDFIAITRRLQEIGIVINEEQQKNLNKYAANAEELETLTKNLGYSNDLNMPSKATYLSQKDLELLKENYDDGYSSFDDLVRIFGYLGCEPEKFGYENNIELSDAAKDFMKSLIN